MKKRINSTGRKKLDSERIDIRINKVEEESNPTFSATLDLSSIPELNPNAKVYVEPYVRSSLMRFDFGTVGAPKSPVDTALTELDSSESFLFRVKVVDESGTVGRILAHANGIRPRDPNDDGTNRKSLLPLVTKDLGERIWSLGYHPDAGPVLQISSKVAGLSAKLKSDPLLQGAIYPMAFREVLLRLTDEDGPDTDLEWFQNWSAFIKALTGYDLVEDDIDDERESFIDDAVRAFTKVHSFATKAAAHDEMTI